MLPESRIRMAAYFWFCTDNNKNHTSVLTVSLLKMSLRVRYLACVIISKKRIVFSTPEVLKCPTATNEVLLLDWHFSRWLFLRRTFYTLCLEFRYVDRFHCKHLLINCLLYLFSVKYRKIFPNYIMSYTVLDHKKKKTIHSKHKTWVGTYNSVTTRYTRVRHAVYIIMYETCDHHMCVTRIMNIVVPFRQQVLISVHFCISPCLFSAPPTRANYGSNRPCRRRHITRWNPLELLHLISYIPVASAPASSDGAPYHH